MTGLSFVDTLLRRLPGLEQQKVLDLPAVGRRDGVSNPMMLRGLCLFQMV